MASRKKNAQLPTSQIIQATGARRGTLKVSYTTSQDDPPSQPLTDKERAVRAQKKKQRKVLGSTSVGMIHMGSSGFGDTSMGSGGNFYSPQLSTDFLEKPQNLRERRAWYRHFYYSNELVGAAIDLHSTIPLSKIRLLRPKTANTDFSEYVYDYFTDMCDRLHLFKRLMEVSHEFWLMGVVHVIAQEHDPYNGDPYSEESQVKQHEGKQRSNMLLEKYKITDKDPNYLGWDKNTIIHPDQVKITKELFSDEPMSEYIPDPQTRAAIMGTTDTPLHEDLSETSKPQVPEKIRRSVEDGGAIPLDTDPNSGTHCCTLTRKKSQYEVQGVSILERCINTLLLRDKLRQAQTSIASRHMTPIRLVWAEEASDTDLDSLREQVDYAMMDPDYSIVTNFEVHWEEMGAQGRLLDLGTEYEHQEQDLYAGLNVTKEILTGEGMYSGSKVNMEILNIQYMQFREMLTEWIENNLFKPVARKKGFVEVDKFGREHLIYPKVSFTRLSIRDAGESFEQVFQLYQKGSVPIDVILEMLNIDPDIAKQRLEADLMTVNDAAFNDFLRAAYGAAGNDFAGKTNIIEKLAEAMHLDYKEEEKPDDAGAGGGGGLRFASDAQAPQVPAVQEAAPATPVDATATAAVPNIGIGKLLANPAHKESMAVFLKEAVDHPEMLEKLATMIRTRKGREG